MIQIIKAGKVPAAFTPKRYQTTCPVCGTLFQYDETDIISVRDFSVGKLTPHIKCPLEGCDTIVIHMEENELKNG